MVYAKFFVLLLFISYLEVHSGESVNASVNKTDQKYYLQPYNDTAFIVLNSGNKRETSQNVSLGNWLRSPHIINEILKNIKFNKSLSHRKRETEYAGVFSENTKRMKNDDYFTIYNGTIDKKLNFDEYFEFMRQVSPTQEGSDFRISVLSELQNKSAKAIKKLEDITVKPMPLLTLEKSATHSPSELNVTNSLIEGSSSSAEEIENIANRTYNNTLTSKIFRFTTRNVSIDDFQINLGTSSAPLSSMFDNFEFNKNYDVSYPYFDTTDIHTSIPNEDKVKQYSTHSYDTNITEEFKNYDANLSVTKETKDIFDAHEVEQYPTHDRDTFTTEEFENYNASWSVSKDSQDAFGFFGYESRPSSTSKLTSFVSTTLPALTTRNEVENAITIKELYITDHFRKSENITEFEAYSSPSFFEKNLEDKYNETRTQFPDTVSKFYSYSSSSSHFVNGKDFSSHSSSTGSSSLNISVATESFDLPSTYSNVSIEVKVQPVAKQEHRTLLTGIILISIGILSIISVLMIVCYYCYNKKKKKTSYEFELTSVKCDGA